MLRSISPGASLKPKPKPMAAQPTFLPLPSLLLNMNLSRMEPLIELASLTLGEVSFLFGSCRYYIFRASVVEAALLA